VAVAHACRQGGADYFAVATLTEALELRAADFDAPILVLGYTPNRHAATLVQARITATLYDTEGIQTLHAAAQAANTVARAHIKVNTGMNRLGVRPADAPALLAAAQALPHVEIEGIFTHFATADTDLDFARLQFDAFADLLTTLAAQGLRPPIAHAANSAATLALPAARLDMVRCGIAIYGLHPDVDSARLPATFEPALSWKAELAQVFTIQPGEAVSYGREYVAATPRTAAVIPVGYADGFPRRPRHWESVLVNGTPAPILGRVCMDQTIIDVSAAAAVGPVRQGDMAVLIGQQGTAELSADTVAARLGTINYDVVSRILARVPRIYVDVDGNETGEWR
ncbi:MAG: alanine racemase, partial [Litorilinea sp.]